MSPEAAPLHDPGLAQRLAVRERIAQVQHRLRCAGHPFRNPPPEPTTCCGRGCNGCVWEGYEAALAWWFEDAQPWLAEDQSPSATTAPEASKGTKDPT